MPWLNDDAPTNISQIIPTLGTFAHICDIRLTQPYFMHTMHAVLVEGGATPEWQEGMRRQINKWGDEICSHRWDVPTASFLDIDNTLSYANTEGYESPSG
jgi:hypothetical protein